MEPVFTSVLRADLLPILIGAVVVGIVVVVALMLRRGGRTPVDAGGTGLPAAPAAPARDPGPDAFATRAQTPAGPEDAFATRSQAPQSPAPGSDVDPYSTRAQHAPAAEADPFSTRAQQPAAPEVDEFSTRAQSSGPAVDPYSTRAQQPVSPEADPYSTRAQAQPTGLDDAFSTRAQQAAPQADSEETFQTRAGAPRAHEPAGAEDAFATRARGGVAPSESQEAPPPGGAVSPAGAGAAPAGEPMTEALSFPLTTEALGKAKAGARLQVLEGPHQGQIFPVLGTVTIGRTPENEVVLDRDTAVSRRHAEVTESRGTYIVRDLGSSNGTYVNDNQVAEVVLSTGDVIRVGRSQIRFEV